MKKISKRFTGLFLSFAMIISLLSFVPFSASTVNAEEQDYSDNITINVSRTVTMASKAQILNKINNLRKEFEQANAEHGYVDEYTYKPIKWSSDMEEIAFTRAIEASYLFEHKRPNGKDIFELESNGGQTSSGEIIASSPDALAAIAQWAEEKEDYFEQRDFVNGNSSTENKNETGHYTALIFSDYIGISSFGVTVGEISNVAGSDEAQHYTGGAVEAQLELDRLDAENDICLIPEDEEYSDDSIYKIRKGSSVTFDAYLIGDWAALNVSGEFSSDTPSIISCTSDGKVTALKTGTAILKFTAGEITTTTSFVVNDIASVQPFSSMKYVRDFIPSLGYVLPKNTAATWTDGHVSSEAITWDKTSFSTNDVKNNMIIVTGKLTNYPDVKVSFTVEIADQAAPDPETGGSGSGSGSGSSSSSGNGSGSGSQKNISTSSGQYSWKTNGSGWWLESTSGWYPSSSWVIVDGFWYYFDADGYMASNEWRDGYWLGSDGSWSYDGVGSWKGNSTGWWFEDTSGWWAANCWQKIDGKWYYFDGSGYMVTSRYIDGYWIGADGVCW